MPNGPFYIASNFFLGIMLLLGSFLSFTGRRLFDDRNLADLGIWIIIIGGPCIVYLWILNYCYAREANREAQAENSQTSESDDDRD